MSNEYEIHVVAESEEQALDLVGKHCFMFVREVKQDGKKL